MKDINVQKLYIGQIINTHREMCDLINDEYKESTRSRMYQRQNWKRFFDFERIGHKYKITKIFAVPKPLIENRGKSEGSRNNNMTYGHYIDPLLIDHLKKRVEKKECNIICTTKQLALEVGLINAQYKDAVQNRDKYYKKTADILKDSINRTAGDDIFYFISPKLKSLIASSLYRIERQEFITFKKIYVIKARAEKEVRAAKNDEIKVIEAMNRVVIKKMGKSKSEINRSHNLMDEYYKKMYKYIIKELPNIEYYFTGYDIFINRFNISKSSQYINKEMSRNELNSLFVSRIFKYLSKKKRQVMVKEEREKEKKRLFIGQPRDISARYIKDILDSNYLTQAVFFINDLCGLK